MASQLALALASDDSSSGSSSVFDEHVLDVRAAAAPTKQKSRLAGLTKMISNLGRKKDQPASNAVAKPVDGPVAAVSDRASESSKAPDRTGARMKSMFKMFSQTGGMKSNKELDNESESDVIDGDTSSPLHSIKAAPIIHDIGDPNLPLLMYPITELKGSLKSRYNLGAVEAFEQSVEVSLQTVNDARFAFADGTKRSNGVEFVELLDSAGDILKAVGKFQMSINLLTEAVQVRRAHNIGTKLQLASSLNDLALVYLFVKKFQESIDAFQDSFNMLNEFYGGIHQDIAASLGNMAVAIRGMSDFSRAITYHEKSIKMMEALAGKDHQDALRQKAQLAITLAAAGDVQLGCRIIRTLIAELNTRHKEKEPFMSYLKYELNRLNTSDTTNAIETATDPESDSFYIKRSQYSMANIKI